jgi:hypothetical protein
MGRRIASVVVIYLGLCVAWAVLGTSVAVRTRQTDGRLHGSVAALWGAPQSQASPELTFTWPERVQEVERVEGENGVEHVTKEKVVWRSRPVLLDGSDVRVDLGLDQRRKGLLWYATYVVAFRGRYTYVHDEPLAGQLVLTYRFPSTQASYDDFRLAVNGKVDPNAAPVAEERGKVVQQRVDVRPGAAVPFEISYRSRGLDSWRYGFGPDVNSVRNFSLVMTTDFRDVDFPQGTLSPDEVAGEGAGKRLTWRSENLISGFEIGMEMPRRLNPGPLAARVAFFAPVCLGFFFVWIFVITLMRKIELHPMNYLFLGAAFFAFHLLFAYSADHLDVVPAFLVSSAVSMFLVISYLRIVVGPRFAAVEAGLAQLLYLVLFSAAHFFEGFTGLIVTIGGVCTLFALMQLTARVRWSDALSVRRPAVSPG